MKSRHLSMTLLVLVLIGQTVYYYPQLPDPMVSNFDGTGSPNSWMEKSSFFVLEFVIVGVLMLQFVGLPWLIERLPVSLINLPNKHYWLAPERRSETVEIFRTYFQWLAVALLALLILIIQLVFRANMSRTDIEPMFLLVLGIYFVFVAVWLIKFVLVFKRTV